MEIVFIIGVPPVAAAAVGSAKLLKKGLLREAAEQLEPKLEKLATTISTASDTRLHTIDEDIDRVENALGQLDQRINETRNNLEQAARDLRDAREEVNSSCRELTSARDDLTSARDRLLKDEAELNDLSIKVKQHTEVLDALRRAFPA